MQGKNVHFIYLIPEAKGLEWKQLHRFLDPGILEQDALAVVIGINLDMSHHAFLYFDALSFQLKETMPVHLPYRLIASILEFPSQQNPIGFLDSKARLEQ